MRVNKLESLEPILNCPVLNEILVGKNSINSLEFVGSCTESLVVLDCSDNKVTHEPGPVLQMCNRLSNSVQEITIV